MTWKQRMANACIKNWDQYCSLLFTKRKRLCGETLLKAISFLFRKISGGRLP